MGISLLLHWLSHRFLHDDLAPLDFVGTSLATASRSATSFFRFGNNGSLIDFTKFKAVGNTLDFRSVLRTGDNIDHRRIALGIFITQNAVKDAVSFCLFGKLRQVFLLERKDLQFLAGLNHIGKPCFPRVLFDWLISCFSTEANRIAIFFAAEPVSRTATSNPSSDSLTICSAASPPLFIVSGLLSLRFFFLCFHLRKGIGNYA